MKKFFGKIKSWWQKHGPTKRRLIQLYAFLLYNANIKGIINGSIFTGNSKYMCVPGLNCYSCPGAVGACPLGALQNALAASNTKAPAYVLGILVLFGLLLARSICGFLCPIGMGQELLYKIKTPKLKKSKVTRILSYFKYVLLIGLVVIIPILYSRSSEAGIAVPAFCKFVCPAGTVGGAVGLLINPANEGLYRFLGPLFTWKFAVLIAVCVASVFIFRFFCRFLCPLGAFYGFFNKIALIGVKLDKNKCTDCGLCVAHCKMDIRKVGDHECVNCGECIDVCPAHAISWKGSKFFLHENTTEAIEAPAEETKPLSAFFAPKAAEGEAVAELPVAASVAAELPVEEAPVTVIPAEPAEDAPQEEGRKEEAPAKAKRGRAFWAQLIAWVLALLVLVGAIVYYNFIAKTPSPNPPPGGEDGAEVGYEVGNLCPEYTLSQYLKEGEVNVGGKGKVTVINFWATWCIPCVGELPYFNTLATEYESVNVVAIYGAGGNETEIASFIEKNGWGDYVITFAKDDGSIASAFGAQALPVTVILDENGIITEKVFGSVHYEYLESLVTPLLA